MYSSISELRVDLEVEFISNSMFFQEFIGFRAKFASANRNFLCNCLVKLKNLYT